MLVDTGPLLAFVDADDPWHLRCRTEMARHRVPYLTTVAVLTEFFHLANRRFGSMQGALTLLRRGWVSVLPFADADVEQALALMNRYADHPMDFADATLVHVAGRESIPTILTIDHDDFETYRFGRNRLFRVLPAR